MDTDYQIFISYRRDGGEFAAKAIYERLTGMGYTVFYDIESLRAGEFDEQLYLRIDEADYILLILSPGGLDRCISDPENDWVLKEIIHSLTCRKKIIPIMLRGFKFPENLPKELEKLPHMHGIETSAASLNSAVDNLASRLLTGIKPVIDPKAPEIKMMDLQELAENGDAGANNDLGIIYEKGEFQGIAIFRNPKKAVECYRRAEELGSSAAVYNIADIYERCSYNLTLAEEYGLSSELESFKVDGTEYHIDDKPEPDIIREYFHQKALEYYKKSSDRHYAPSYFKLGTFAEKDHDADKAFGFYEKAARQKYRPALNALAWMYSTGNGAAEDPDKAEELYEQAARSGEEVPEAIYNYARMIEKSNPDRAMSLYIKAASGPNGLPLASYALGRKYEFQYRDYRKAVTFYEKAAAGGISGAEADLERCRNRWNK